MTDARPEIVFVIAEKADFVVLNRLSTATVTVTPGV